LKILTDDAENGITEAQMNLGMMLRFGLVVPKDEKEAAKW
jgi:TPR repeat protein